MSPRSLLFSSDQETLRRLAQAFAELEFEVESCPDIFSALEMVTSRRFDIILADLDQGPEAGFLVKTAHELKLNQGAFAFAVATGTAYAEPEEFGVELVLAKPIIPNQVKYALLSCDGFLACMRSWSVPGDAAAMKETTAVVRTTPEPLPARPKEQSAVRKLPVRPAEPSPTLNQGPVKGATSANFAPLTSNPWPTKSASPAPAAPAPSRSAPVQPKKQVSQGKVLWSTTLGVSILAFAYGASRPSLIRTVFAGMEQVFDRSSEDARSNSDEPEDTKPGDSEAIGRAAAFPPLRVRAAAPSPPRSIPARRSPTPGQVHPAETIQAKVNPEPELLPVAGHTVQIPDSIRRAQPETDSGHTVLGQLGPINLPEDAAEQLLSQRVQPNYPEQALKAGLQGAVVLQAWIGTDGSIRELKLVRGSLLLGQAAYQAVKQWRYKPYLLNGKAVEAQTYVTVNFRLPQQSLLLPSAH